MNIKELAALLDPEKEKEKKEEPIPLIDPISMQQEDNIIHSRLSNDEKGLRRITKKFHNYTTVAYGKVLAPSPVALPPTAEDARDAFLIELASFHLTLQKNLMVCEAEARQVEEYQREKERIVNEHARLKDQIEELKHSLEQAQIHRKRKQEYDVIAEKINALPSRDDLTQLINSLENDMSVIRAEQDNQDRILLAQQAALTSIVSSIQDARTLGKPEQDAPDDTVATPAPEEGDVEMGSPGQEEHGEIREEPRPEKEGEMDGERERVLESDDEVPLAMAKKLLNPAARTFIPPSHSHSHSHSQSQPQSRISTPQLPSSAPTPSQAHDTGADAREEGEADDIEMGELAEEPVEKPAATSGKRRPAREELEEGEASDMSSELSEIPSDTEL